MGITLKPRRLVDVFLTLPGQHNVIAEHRGFADSKLIFSFIDGSACFLYLEEVKDLFFDFNED